MNYSIRILIVDDDEVDRMAVRYALIESGLSIISTEASTCAEAIELLETNHFDCTFVDYGLPDQSGLLLIQAARRLKVNHPLVVLTGQNNTQIAVELMKSGATDYLAKSQISPTSLAQVLRNAIRIYRSEQESIEISQQLQKNYQLLLEKNRELDKQRAEIEIHSLQQADFIAHLTHDLRTPLVAANLMFQLFKEESFGPLSEPMHEGLEAMERSNQNLLDLVNTLLEVYHYEFGTKTLTLISCDLWEIIQDVIQQLQPLVQHKLLTLQSINHISDPRLGNILGDYQEIRRMITNLIGNAVKFTDQGRIELQLGFEPAMGLQASQLKGWITIDIQDTGAGISPEEQLVIFNRFRTGHHRQVGSGLGLYLVHQIVTKHSGSITVISEPGQGSLFKVRLPIDR